MGHIRFLPFIRCCLALCFGVLSGWTGALAQGTAFIYQGQLTDGPSVANGAYDLRFSLWNAATAGDQQGAALVRTGIEVTNGLFNTTLDFGGGFSGASRWLEIAVRTNGATDFTPLAERQPVLPTPYAIHATTAGIATTATTATSFTGQISASQITNTLSPAQIPNLDASRITGGTFTGNGLGLTNIPLGALVEREHTVVAWGDSSHGQTSIPGSLTNVAKIVGGFNYGMALRPGGTVVAWGDNAAGKATVPVGLTGVVDIAAGNSHSLAVKQDGTVVAWGYNSSGETTVPSSLNQVTAVAAGALFSVARKADGTVVAWGDPLHGQTAVPAGLSQVVSISAGLNHCLALKTDGTVVAWGRNTEGQTTVPSGLGGVVAVAAGAVHSLALKANGTVVAWGHNVQGQTNVPIGLNGVMAIAAGASHNLALKSDGSVVAWGNNVVQQSNVPAVATRVVAIAAGYYSSFAVRKESGSRFAHLDRANTFSGVVTAPGFSGDGSSLTNLNASALSTGTVPAARVPNLDAGKISSGVLSPDRIPTLDASKISGGTFTGNGAGLSGIPLNALVQSDYSVAAWGDNTEHQTTVPDGLTAVAAVAASADYSLALKADGTVVAWGDNFSGQTDIPAGLSGVMAVAAGEAHSLALKADGTVVAWGSTFDDRANIPAGLSGVVAIAAGFYHSLALKTDGTVVAWGYDSDGQANVPAGLSGVVAVAAGNLHSLALKTDGTVVAWGYNFNGQTNVPAGLSGVVAVAAGEAHSLALKADGTVVAWGYNFGGQTNVPGDLGGVVAIAGGGLHSLALKADGTVVVWGRSDENQAPAPIGLSGVKAISAGRSHCLALKAGIASQATLARLDQGNVFRGTVSAVGFSGSGSGLTSLSASALSSGTLADARLGGNVARLNGSPAFAPAAGTRAASFIGSRTGDHDDAVIHAENVSTSGSASPALRVLGRGTAAEGALSVSADAGPIARFGNATAWVAHIDNTGGFSATSFSGNGSGLASLNASALTTGTVPVARLPDLDAAKISAGTLADARLSANVALLNGSAAFTSSVRLADTNLFLRGGSDTNHGLAWFGGSRSFAGNTVDGPVLYGFLGGALGSTKTAAKIALSWNDSADVSLGGDLTVTNSLSVSSPAGTRAASLTGSRTGNNASAVVHVENTSTSGTASPVLRVLGRGTSIDGALSVSADTGRIARFGNATDWVALLDNNGTFSATSFVTLSDRNKKAGFEPVDVETVLAKVAALPLTTWHYTNDAAATPHLGTMAQDFNAAFGLGGDDKTIATVDADGVAFAAIQGLNLKTETLAGELAAQRAENSALREEIGELRNLVLQLQRQINGGRP